MIIYSTYIINRPCCFLLFGTNYVFLLLCFA